MTYCPKPIDASYPQIEMIAEHLIRLLDENGLNRLDQQSTQDYLAETVNRLNGNIIVSHAPSPLEEDGGSLTIAPDLSFLIRLSPTTSMYRDNFTIAHELGHYMLHYPHQKSLNEPMHFARYGSNKMEWQANRFAAAFLMPKSEFLKMRNDLNDDTLMLSMHFEVSTQAIDVRKQYIQAE